MKIGIGNDHHGLYEKEIIKTYLKSNNIEYIDFGTNDDEKVDYVDYGLKVCKAINNNEINKGILICGTGIGMSIVANKVNGIRCARILSEKDAYYARLHNNANVIAIPENILEEDLTHIIDKFINTEFSTEERHIKRVEKINNI